MQTLNIATKNGYGPQGDVGVNYTVGVERPILKQTPVGAEIIGKRIEYYGWNVKNLYGLYNGADNPKKYWEKPNVDGDFPDDYGLPPIDEADLNGMLHDKDYDDLRLRGLKGVLDKESTPANEAYRKRAAKIVEKEKKKKKDVITGKPVTKKAADAAHKYSEKGIKSFRTAEAIKKL